MNVLEFIATIAGGAFLFWGTVVTARSGKAKGVTDKQVEESKDPGVDALKTVLRLEGRLAKVEEKAETLGKENRLFRRVIRGTIDLLRRIPPPANAEILAFILTHIPTIEEDDEGEDL